MPDRRALADEAARLLQERGASDPKGARGQLAKKYAMNAPDLPDNEDILRSLALRQRLFSANTDSLQKKREAALEAMTFFAEFSPRLVGPVWTGSADEHSPIQLHLYADSPESLDGFLTEHSIPFRERSISVYFGGKQRQRLPLYEFGAGADDVEIILLSSDQRQPPFDDDTQAPQSRGTRKSLERLLKQSL